MTLSDFGRFSVDQVLKSISKKHYERPPVDIEAIARSLGAEVVYERLLCDGSLKETAQNRYLVRVNKETNRMRQRFTIAHETAHIILKSANRSKIIPLTEESFPEEEIAYNGSDEERICNDIAASLLVPQQVAKQLSDWRSLSIRKIEKAAREWQVSIDVLLRRVLVLAPYEGGFIWHKIASNQENPTDISMRYSWAVFPKSRAIRIPNSVWVYAPSDHSPIDIARNEERFFWKVKFDLDGLSGYRAIRVKAFGKGNEKRVLVIVYPREFKPQLTLSSRRSRQTILSVES